MVGKGTSSSTSLLNSDRDPPSIELLQSLPSSDWRLDAQVSSISFNTLLCLATDSSTSTFDKEGWTKTKQSIQVYLKPITGHKSKKGHGTASESLIKLSVSFWVNLHNFWCKGTNLWWKTCIVQQKLSKGTARTLNELLLLSWSVLPLTWVRMPLPGVRRPLNNECRPLQMGLSV